MSSESVRLVFSIFLLAMPGVAQGKVLLTPKEALELAFPECEVERKTHYLDEQQRQHVAELAGGSFEQGIVFAYEARRDGELVGTAWFDAHRVRTLKETLMIVVDPRQRVTRIEVLAFAEPQDYLPRSNFYAQFQGRVLDEDLHPKRGIRGVTGATLTARATVDAVRRVLAIHQVLHGPPPRAPAKDGQ